MIALYNSCCVLVSTSLLAVATFSIPSTLAIGAKVAVARHPYAALTSGRGKRMKAYRKIRGAMGTFSSNSQAKGYSLQG